MSDTTAHWQMQTPPIDPGHYALKMIEPIAVIEAWGLGFHLGSAVKYIARCEDKGSRRDDLIKAANYLFREATGRWLPKEVLDAEETEVVQEVTGRDEGDTSGLAEAVRSYFKHVSEQLPESGHSDHRRQEVPRGTAKARRKRRKQDNEVAASKRLRDRLRGARRRET